MSKKPEVSPRAQKRYFWLKLQNTFFERDEIKIIESMPNGKDYIIFYLKLMLKAINDNGRLMFRDTIPYTPDMLSSITQTSIDTVRVAIEAFVKLGLIEVLTDGALYMEEVKKLVGSETPDAERKRLERSGKTKQAKLLSKENVRTLSGTHPENVTLENKSIELKSTDITPYNPPAVDGGVGLWLSTIKEHGYKFTADQVRAISAWAKYKADKRELVSSQQIELTLKQLNEHLLAKQNIVYLIETSIARGYKGIMEPTKLSVSGVQAPVSKYQATEYIIPETPLQQKELCNYLERCYTKFIK